MLSCHVTEIVINSSLLVPGDPSRQGTHIFTLENSRAERARHASCTYLLWKFRNQGRQVTSIYVLVDTVEISRRWKTRHTHLSSYRGNLKNLCVLSYFRIGVHSEHGNPNYVYVYICTYVCM